ncbi:uncharacterized protein LOC143880884 isoform X2 [Tasmannia lanceolata]|uniref:uncharacterized protein LOC143880884 isoform X2 n=1 Tax=Tasmannia lanceolata TaxID=3420 RepID=UPI004062BFD7
MNTTPEKGSAEIPDDFTKALNEYIHVKAEQTKQETNHFLAQVGSLPEIGDCREAFLVYLCAKEELWEKESQFLDPPDGSWSKVNDWIKAYYECNPEEGSAGISDEFIKALSEYIRVKAEQMKQCTRSWSEVNEWIKAYYECNPEEGSAQILDDFIKALNEYIHAKAEQTKWTTKPDILPLLRLDGREPLVRSRSEFNDWLEAYHKYNPEMRIYKSFE